METVMRFVALFRPIALAAFIASMANADLRAADTDITGLRVPSPTGPNAIGTFSVRLSDTARSNPFLKDGSRRELMVRFWYPAVRTSGCAPAEYISPKVRAYLSDRLGIPALDVRTNSCLQAPVLAGRHPVILASHGYTGMYTDYTFLFEDLASRGYVVASIAHAYESTALELPDGKLLTSRFGTYLAEDTLRMDDSWLNLATSIRQADLRFVCAELRRWDERGGPLFGKLDLSRIGVLGHSMGADTVMTGLRLQLEIKAALLLDPIALSKSATAGSNKPVMLVNEGREQWSDEECELWNHLRGAKYAVLFPGADHFAPTDAVWLGAYLSELQTATGNIGPAKTVDAIRNYVAAFFGSYLSGEPPGRLQNSLSTEYAGVAVVTRSRPLCPVLTIPAEASNQARHDAPHTAPVTR
jgi:dienelactone hydrolase